MLPDLGALALRARRAAPTGEFIKLSRAEARQLNKSGELEPINRSKYMPSDCEPGEEERFGDDYECFEPFKVWARDPATGRPSRHYKIYNAQALWDALKFDGQLRDPIFRQPIWREDWWELHQKYDPDGDVPRRVHTLPRKDKDEGYDTDDDDDSYSEEEDWGWRATLAEQQAFDDQVNCFCRFWLKGPINDLDVRDMRAYFARHFRVFFRQNAEFVASTGLTIDDVATFDVELEPYDLGTPGVHMPVWKVDCQMVFVDRDKATRFLEWSGSLLESWSWKRLAQNLFGVMPVLDTGPPYNGRPQEEDEFHIHGYFGSRPVLPRLTWSQYNAQENWALRPLYRFLPTDF